MVLQFSVMASFTIRLGKMMRIYNHKGIFSNTEDSEEGLSKILSTYFENIKVMVIGTVALFSASGKKSAIGSNSYC